MKQEKSILGCHIVLLSRPERRERVKAALLCLLLLSVACNVLLVVQLHDLSEPTFRFDTEPHVDESFPVKKPVSRRVKKLITEAQQPESNVRELLDVTLKKLKQTKEIKPPKKKATKTTTAPPKTATLPKAKGVDVPKVNVSQASTEKTSLGQTQFQQTNEKYKNGPVLRPTRVNSDVKDDNKLHCELFGGPMNDAALEDMMYWRTDEFALDDSSIVQPEKYLIFEIDEAGFSNVRLSFENVVALAKITHRILVLPPATRFAQLLRGSGIPSYFLADFFKIRNLPVMRMEDFLSNVELRYRANGTIAIPPDNRTNWDGRLGNAQQSIPGDGPLLYSFLNSTMPTYEFRRDDHIVVVGNGTWTAEALADIVNTGEGTKEKKMQQRIMRFLGNPPSVDASLSTRLQELMGSRTELRNTSVYDNEKFMFVQGHEDTRHRPLIQFYASYFFEDWKKAIWMRRFIRDNLRFADFLQCAAARIVEAMREHSRSHGTANGSFDTMHVRRKDFRTLPNYKEGTVPANNLVEDKYFAENRTIYIATDENDAAYFKPLQEHYHVYLLKDFMHLVEGIDPNYFGMIEQLVCAKGDLFVGTFYSTFTAYINRLRGYYALKYKKAGHLEGSLDSEYFGHKGVHRNVLRKYNALTYQLWTREWPMAWRDIDRDLDTR